MAPSTPAPTPIRGVYGFAMYITCRVAFILFFVWALVPDSVLHYFHLTYYPQKYWAIALPVWFLMGLSLFAFFVYPATNQLLAPDLGDMRVICDRQSQGDLLISDVCNTLYLADDYKNTMNYNSLKVH